MPSHEIYFDLIDRDAADWRIFLLTDEAQCIEGFLERYGSRVTFHQCHQEQFENPGAPQPRGRSREAGRRCSEGRASGAALSEVHRSWNVEPVLHHLRLEGLVRGRLHSSGAFPAASQLHAKLIHA